MSVRFIATIEPVIEVTLYGRADLGYWTDWLRPWGLAPRAVDGQAEVLLSSVDSRYRGLGFQEFSCSVAVEAPAAWFSRPEARQPGYFLCEAFSSRRLLAWMERTIFGTPYLPGEIEVQASLPARLVLDFCGVRILSACCPAQDSTGARRPLRSGPETWEGPIFLARPGLAAGPPRWFLARLDGPADVYCFQPEVDRFEISSAAPLGALAPLSHGGFQGHSWVLRKHGRHARSKTFD